MLNDEPEEISVRSSVCEAALPLAFANSDTTTNLPVVLLNMTLNILFIRRLPYVVEYRAVFFTKQIYPPQGKCLAATVLMMERVI